MKTSRALCPTREPAPVLEQALEMRVDRSTSGGQAVTHRGYIRPLIDGDAGGDGGAEVAAKGHHAVRAGDILARDQTRLLAAEVDAVGAKRGGDLGGDVGSGLRAREVGGHAEPSRGGEARAAGRGPHALGRAVKTDAEDAGIVAHDFSPC